MNNKLPLVFVILIFIGGAIFLLPNDEKKIRKNLQALAEYGSTVANEPMLKTVQKTAQAAKLCTTPFKVKYNSLHIDRGFDRKELSDRILMIKRRLPGTTLKFEDVTLKFPADSRAEITTTLRINGKLEDSQFIDAYEIKLTADKNERDWLFSSFTIIEFMEK